MKSHSNCELLTIYDALPSLLDLAHEQAKLTGEDAYKIQDELRDQFFAQGRAFRWSMPYRSLFKCFQCGLMTTQIQHMLINPPMREINPSLHAVDLKEEDLHYIRQHSVTFSDSCRKFLEQIANTLE